MERCAGDDSHEPQLLNHQLIELYDLLPRRDQRFVETEIAPIKHFFGLPGGEWRIPKDSELKERILFLLSHLLLYAHITPSFQQVILEVFEGLCDRGTWKEIEPDNSEMRTIHNSERDGQKRKDFIYDTIIVNSMDGGGIFDPNDAIRIERIAYHRELLGQLSINEAMSRFYRYLNKQGGNNGEYKPNPNLPGLQRIRKWRQEFISKFHEEP